MKTRRDSKGVTFVQINDGSSFRDLQVVIDPAQLDPADLELVSTGACVMFSGDMVDSPGEGQSVELKATGLTVYGGADPATYPMQKNGASFEFLRESAHLRVRGNTFGAVNRVRNRAAWAIHSFFADRGFLWVNTPIITASDCEGAGAKFAQTSVGERWTLRPNPGWTFEVTLVGAGADTIWNTGACGNTPGTATVSWRVTSHPH